MLKRFSLILLCLLGINIVLYANSNYNSSHKDERTERLKHKGSLSKFVVDEVYKLDLTLHQKEKIDTLLEEFKSFRKRSFNSEDFLHDRKKRRHILKKAKKELRQNIKNILNDEQIKQLKNRIKHFKAFKKRHHDSRCNDRR